MWFTDIDECQARVSPCDLETTDCVNTDGSYDCKCKERLQPIFGMFNNV